MNIRQIHNELQAVGVPISGYWPETQHTDPGLEIDNMYIVQLARYCNPPIFLDTLDMKEVGEFASIGDLIKFLMET